MYRSGFRLLIVIGVLALGSCPVLAQQIDGQVRYAQGGAPAYRATVRCSGVGCSGRVYTDRNGRFHLRFARPGRYNITVEAPGFLTEERSVALLAYSDSEYMFFHLRRDPSGEATLAAPPGVIYAGVPPMARTEFEMGRDALAAEGRRDEGIAHLEKAITLYPKFLEAHILLGRAYVDNHQLEKAESVLRRALKIDSKSAEARFVLGEVYRQQKKYTEAEKMLLAGLKIEDSWQGHIALGRLYYDQGDVTKAGAQVGKTLQLKPDLAEGHLLAGNIFLKAHQAENALVEFQEYLRLEPKGEFAAQAQEMVEKIKKALADEKK